jgi:thiosulfate/3-mercaptopyruvate sulfurtransferase
MTPIIEPQELLNLTRADYILFDVSAGSKPRYSAEHLEGALFIDLNNDLAEIRDFAKGGRHPLPALNDFFEMLGSFGVTSQSHVILYDDKNGANAAARFWWMLRAIGHEKVQVINGGYQAAVEAGYPVSSEIISPKPLEYIGTKEWQLSTATIEEVQVARENPQNIVVDVRDANRFAGLTEPIDLIAGHIPGAINVPFTENLDAAGLFLSPEVLKSNYEKIFKDVKIENVVVHCGSGVTACHTLLALDYAGLGVPKLYVGSWSEWSRNDKPMALKSETL